MRPLMLLRRNWWIRKTLRRNDCGSGDHYLKFREVEIFGNFCSVQNTDLFWGVYRPMMGSLFNRVSIAGSEVSMQVDME